MSWAGLFFLSRRPFEGPFIFACSFNACQRLSYFNAVCQSPSDFIYEILSQLSWAPLLFLAIQFIYLSCS